MNVSISTWVLVDAILPSLLVLALPARYAIFLATSVLAIRFLDTILVALGLWSSHLIDGVMEGKSCAQIPNRDSHFFSPPPGLVERNIFIFLLAARDSHALRMLVSSFKQLGSYFCELSVVQSEDATDDGCKSKPRTCVALVAKLSPFCSPRLVVIVKHRQQLDTRVPQYQLLTQHRRTTRLRTKSAVARSMDVVEQNAQGVRLHCHLL
jgi:hypothetical protein